MTVRQACVISSVCQFWAETLRKAGPRLSHITIQSAHAWGVLRRVRGVCAVSLCNMCCMPEDVWQTMIPRLLGLRQVKVAALPNATSPRTQETVCMASQILQTICARHRETLVTFELMSSDMAAAVILSACAPELSAVAHLSVRLENGVGPPHEPLRVRDDLSAYLHQCNALQSVNLVTQSLQALQVHSIRQCPRVCLAPSALSVPLPPLNIDCGICGLRLFESLSAYVIGPPTQPQLTLECFTDAPPTQHVVPNCHHHFNHGLLTCAGQCHGIRYVTRRWPTLSIPMFPKSTTFRAFAPPLPSRPTCPVAYSLARPHPSKPFL